MSFNVDDGFVNVHLESGDTCTFEASLHDYLRPIRVGVQYWTRNTTNWVWSAAVDPTDTEQAAAADSLRELAEP